MQNAGISGTVKLVSHPQEDYSLMVRIENLADSDSSMDIVTVDIEKVAKAFWKAANGAGAEAKVTFEEVSITGNMLISEMKARKIKWKYEGQLVPTSDNVISSKIEIYPL